MSEKFIRCEKLLGKDAISKLQKSRIAVFGAGGVGGYAIEALVRSGLGAIDIIDKDVIETSNINRQIIATTKTIGLDKVEVMKDRILSINPNCKVMAHKVFFLPETADLFDFKQYDYIVDAIDTVKGKIELIKKAKAEGVKIISSMGAGNKLNTLKFEVSDIYKTSVCPLARVMRGELKKIGIKKLKVVYSKETPIKTQDFVGSSAFCAPAMGLIIAHEVAMDLIKQI